MTRAYSPRLSTVHLIADILTLRGVASCRTLPPTRSRPTMLRITLEGSSGDGQPIRSDFTIRDAREWLAHERGRMP
jgi:hypothetical protein